MEPIALFVIFFQIAFVIWLIGTLGQMKKYLHDILLYLRDIRDANQPEDRP